MCLTAMPSLPHMTQQATRCGAVLDSATASAGAALQEEPRQFPCRGATPQVSGPEKKPAGTFLLRFFYWLIARSSLGAFSSFKPQVHSSKTHFRRCDQTNGRLSTISVQPVAVVSRFLEPPLASLMHQEATKKPPVTSPRPPLT